MGKAAEKGGLNANREPDTLSGMSTEPAPDQFAFELVKLLLQVAWVDDDISPEESGALLAFARKSQLTSEQLEVLSACLAGKAPLPPPNLAILKPRRVDVLRAAKNLVQCDLRVGAAEETILEQISTLLR
jgi:hypothetical protein